MSWRRFFTRVQNDADLQQQIEFHLQEQLEENLACGMNAEEARRQAYLKLGNQRGIRETVWEANRLGWIEDTWRDFRYAVRTLWRSPGFAVTAVVVMALGIGANTALFTVVRSVLLRPLPFTDPNGLVRIYESDSHRPGGHIGVPSADFFDWQKQARTFEQMAMMYAGNGGYNLSGPEDNFLNKSQRGVRTGTSFRCLACSQPWAVFLAQAMTRRVRTLPLFLPGDCGSGVMEAMRTS
jgi:putative ABC transport system permease protein